MSNLESSDQAVPSVDGNCTTRLKDKTSLRLRLGRVFSSSGLNSPKSPKSVSSSSGSSPSHGSPRVRTRYSWQLGTYSGEENRSPCTSESGISLLSSSTKSPSIINTTSSPKSPSTPKSPCSSTWYGIDRTLRAAHGTTVVHQSRVHQPGSQSSRGARRSSLGRRAITSKHESIRYEILAAAAAATAEAAEVGEQRRRIHGRYPQPNVAVRHAGAA